MSNSQTLTACRVLEDKMQEAERTEREHDMLEKRHRAQKEAAKIRKDSLRSVILELDPHYKFGEAQGLVVVTDILSDQGEPSQGLPESTHKQNYGRWAKVAKDALRLAGGGGTFASLRDTAIGHCLVPQNITEKELEGLRGALHGLARRRVIDYTPGSGGAGGRFSLKRDG